MNSYTEAPPNRESPDVVPPLKPLDATPSPFEANPFNNPGKSGGRWRRRVVFGTSVTALIAAIAVTVLVTRRTTVPIATQKQGQPVAQPVTLTADGARRIGVTFATASLQVLAGTVRTIAQVTFDETRVKIIAPKIDGWIDQLIVNQTGQVVSAGDPLLAIYSPMLVSAQQELLLAVGLLHDVANGDEDARRSATELRDAARRRLSYWDIGATQIAELERTGVVQKTVVLRSPVGGVVVEKNVLGGQKTMAGEALFKIADLSTVWLEGEVFERDLASVRTGAAVTVDLEAFPGERTTGRISYIYPTLNAETRTERVRVVIANPSMRLKPGMYATLYISTAATASAVTVPRGAVLATGGRSLVFVRSAAGSLEPRVVTLGASTETLTQIIAGLAAGEVVVASATFLVDAESNLGSAVAGLGMPGMDMSTPPKPKTPVVTPPRR